MNFNDYLKKELEDPEIKAAHDALETDLQFQMSNLVEMARLQAGITQSELAKRMGSYQSAIARVESEALVPTLPFLKRVATALGLRLVLPRFATMASMKISTDTRTVSVLSPFRIQDFSSTGNGEWFSATISNQFKNHG